MFEFVVIVDLRINLLNLFEKKFKNLKKKCSLQETGRNGPGRAWPGRAGLGPGRAGPSVSKKKPGPARPFASMVGRMAEESFHQMGASEAHDIRSM